MVQCPEGAVLILAPLLSPNLVLFPTDGLPVVKELIIWNYSLVLWVAHDNLMNL